MAIAAPLPRPMHWKARPLHQTVPIYHGVLGVCSAQERQFWDNGGSAGDWRSLDQQQDIRVNLAGQTACCLPASPKFGISFLPYGPTQPTRHYSINFRKCRFSPGGSSAIDTFASSA